MSDDSDSEDVDEIREQKADELRSKLTAPDEPVHVTGEDHLEELIEDHSPVLVDFYADWCGPCKMLEPVVETLAADTSGTVAKVDVDEHQRLAGEYDVQGVPTLYLFADGEPIERLVGGQDEATLRNLIESHT